MSAQHQPVPRRWRVVVSLLENPITVRELPGILEEARGLGAAWLRVGHDGVPEDLIVEWSEDDDLDAFDIAEALHELRANHPDLPLPKRPIQWEAS